MAATATATATSALRTFLASRRAPKGSKTWNVSGMGPHDMGIYSVSDAEYDEFLHLHYEHVFVYKQPSALLERHATYTPLLIDLDFRYGVAGDGAPRRIFEKDHVFHFVKAYADAFFRFIDYSDSLRFFVSTKPAPLVEGDVMKDGIHIVCPDITVDYNVPFTLRKYLLEQSALSVFPPFTNTAADCFDESVIQRNNWFLHGATKPDRDRYSVVYCFVADPDGGFEEMLWDENDREFTDLFSLRKGRDTQSTYSVREAVREEWTMWESISEKGVGDACSKRELVAAGGAGREDAASTVSHLSDGISKILNIRGCMWEVHEMSEGYKVLHNSIMCLVNTEHTHTDRGHSCLFVQRSAAIFSCFSHKTKRLPKGRSEKLWRLLTDEESAEDAVQSAYAAMKVEFEKTAFRILDPPGYMVHVGSRWIHYTRPQLIDMNSGLFLDDEKKERFIDWWLRDAHIRTYSRVGYFVDSRECPLDVFNRFRGFAGSYAESAECSIDPILYHLRTVISDNDPAVYDFILDWLAAIVQCPRKLNGICLVVMGQHGAGKDILFNWFGSKIIGMEAYYKTARPHIDMFGSFNSSRLNRVFYHIEEGNSKAFNGEFVEQFKNFITDEFASIQLKGRDTCENEVNYNHFVVSSNNAIPFDIHRDERRFFAVSASNTHVRDNAYFNALGECLKSPGVVHAFYELLIARDISGRDWKNPPPTAALTEWKHSCESGVSVFLEHYTATNPDVDAIKSSELYAVYSSYCREYRQTAINLRQFGIEAKRLIGDPEHRKTGNYYILKNTIEIV